MIIKIGVFNFISMIVGYFTIGIILIQFISWIVSEMKNKKTVDKYMDEIRENKKWD